MFTRKNKFILSIATLLLFSALSSCDDVILFTNCNECYSYIPDYYDIKIKFTINDENPEVNYTLYKGSFETGEPIHFSSTSTKNLKLNVETNCYYTIVAEYCSESRSIMVVDGHKVEFNRNISDCESECYYPTGIDFDVRLKY